MRDLDQIFDSHVLNELDHIVEDVWQITSQGGETKNLVAARVIAAARSGERDPVKLRAAGVGKVELAYPA